MVDRLRRAQGPHLRRASTGPSASGQGHRDQDRRAGRREDPRPRSATTTIYIFLLPPSIEALEQRLVDRATEDPASLRTRRQELAVSELALKDTYDHQVVNDDAARAAREIHAIIEAGRRRAERSRHDRWPRRPPGPGRRRRQRRRLQGVRGRHRPAPRGRRGAGRDDRGGDPLRDADPAPRAERQPRRRRACGTTTAPATATA